MVKFDDIAPVSSSIIMVVGVGGGGGNAVNHMYRMGITDVSFMVCNTDRQALARSPIPTKVALGEQLTEGLGAGNKPERGRAAAEESIEEVKEKLLENDIKMVFVTAGMGGGTGTGAAPVIAKAAKDLGILTVAIVTIPFKTEGRKRILQAIEGIEEIRHNVDSLLVINNENIHEIYGELTLSEAFGKADDILATAARSIAEIITLPSNVNVDFADVQTVMKDSGIALMGSARGSGENRAMEVAEAAMSSPLLNHKDIRGAKNVLLNIMSGSKEVTLTETYQVTQFVQERTRNNNETDLIWGAGIDESLGDDIQITVIATGFDMASIPEVSDRYSEIVNRGGHETGDRPAGGGSRGRETVPLFEPEEDLNAKKTPVLDEGADDFSLVTKEDPAVTHAQSEGSGYYDPYYGSSGVDTSSVSENTWTTSTTPSAGTDNTSVYQQPEKVETYTPPVVVAQPEEQNVQAAYTEEQPEEPQQDLAMEYPVEDRSITTLTEDELENIPAYIRRKMKIENEALPEGKISRETLGGDSRGRKDKKNPGNSGGGLFD